MSLVIPINCVKSKVGNVFLHFVNHTTDIFPFGCNGFCSLVPFSWNWLIVMLTLPETFLLSNALRLFLSKLSPWSFSLELHFDIVQNVFWVDVMPVVRYNSEFPLFRSVYSFGIAWCNLSAWFSSSTSSLAGL